MDEEERPVSLFFGSSDTGMFSLLRGDSIRVNRFPGATAKGLGQGNAKSKAIEHTILHKYCRSPIHALVWMFGTVDVKFSYYFKACTEQQSEGEIDPEAAMMSCAVKYFNFVRSMHAATNAMTVVIGCEPNGAPPDRVYEQLLRYGIVLDSPQNRQKVNDAVKVCRPETLRRTFNATLEQLCQVSGFHYIDIDNDILHENAFLLPADRSVVRDEHMDIQATCVHLNWEANLLKYIPKLQKLGFQIEETLDLENTRQEYIEEKLNRPVKKKPRTARGVTDD